MMQDAAYAGCRWANKEAGSGATDPASRCIDLSGGDYAAAARCVSSLRLFPQIGRQPFVQLGGKLGILQAAFGGIGKQLGKSATNSDFFFNSAALAYTGPRNSPIRCAN